MTLGYPLGLWTVVDTVQDPLMYAVPVRGTGE